MATAGEIIKGALRLIGQLAEGEIPTNETYADSLSAMNEMIDAWSIESLAVHTTQDQTITWPANYASRSIGPTGDLTATRPIQVDDATYFVVSGVSYPIFVLNQEQYRSIAVKAATSAYPTFLYADMEMPDITVYVYPVPTQSIELHLVSVQPLTQPATILTSLVIPPGYQRAFRYNLACALASEFGRDPPGWVVKTAAESKAAIERINDPMLWMSLPADLRYKGVRYDINTG